MNTFNGDERRTSALQHWSLAVEVGVNHLRTISYDAAVTSMVNKGVGADVVRRVTSPNGRRRLTKWELHVDEAALRKALGARPLLNDPNNLAFRLEHAA